GLSLALVLSPDARRALGLRSLLLLVDHLVVALFDNFVIGSGRAVFAAGGRRRRLLLRGCVDRLRQLVRRLLQRVGLGADLADVVAFESLLQLHDPALDRPRVGLVERGAMLLERTLRLVGELLGVVLRVRDL